MHAHTHTPTPTHTHTHTHTHTGCDISATQKHRKSWPVSPWSSCVQTTVFSASTRLPSTRLLETVRSVTGA